MSTKPYTITEVPPRDDGGSRYFLETSIGGFATEPGANVAAVYSHLVQAREREAVAVAPPEVKVELYAVVQDKTGHRLKRRGVLLKPQIYAPNRPTKIAKLTSTPGELLDGLLRGEGEGWETAPDLALWAALLRVAEFHGWAGRALRGVNESVARCLAVRAGIEAPHPSALPQLHLVADDPRSFPATEPEQSEDEPADEEAA